MQSIEREVAFTFGPRFYEENLVTMFEYRIDSRNCVGPRPATPDDAKKYPKEFRAYMDAEEAKPEPSMPLQTPAQDPPHDPEPGSVDDMKKTLDTDPVRARGVPNSVREKAIKAAKRR
jgi:hypothetical protein